MTMRCLTQLLDYYIMKPKNKKMKEKQLIKALEITLHKYNSQGFKTGTFLQMLNYEIEYQKSLKKK